MSDDKKPTRGKKPTPAWRSGLSEAGSLGAVTAGGAFRRRRHRKTQGRDDPNAGVDFKAIYADESATVTADDGVSLAVRTVTTGDGAARGSGVTLTQRGAPRTWSATACR